MSKEKVKICFKTSNISVNAELDKEAGEIKFPNTTNPVRVTVSEDEKEILFANTNIPVSVEILRETPPVPPLTELCFEAKQANSIIRLRKEGSPTWTGGEYSLDRSTWNEYVPGTTSYITLQNIGDKIYFRGNMVEQSADNYIYFVINGKFEASGNINSIYAKENYNNITEYNINYCFYKLFYTCIGLTKAPVLPVTKLSESCYSNMFAYCSDLEEAPELPATELASNCYDNMFNGCSSLVTAPSLPATELASYCYSNMFYGCSSLVTAPSLPATELASNCYESMFYACRSLVTVPKLNPTSTESNACDKMFFNCRALKVYTQSGEGYDKPWNIPESGPFTDATYSYSNMFAGVTTDNVPSDFTPVVGEQVTYYTQNDPV